MLRRVLSVLAGLAAGFATVFLIEMISTSLFPMPAGLDPANAEAMRAYIAALPAAAFALVLFAMFSGALVAGLTAARLAGRQRRAGWIAGGIVVAATVINIFAIPHPQWFAAASVGLAAVGAWLGARLGGEGRAA
jgi:hypothetical protein